jgi:hypothetical protein
MQCEIRVISDDQNRVYVAAVADDGTVMAVNNVLCEKVNLSTHEGILWQIDCSFGWSQTLGQPRILSDDL